MRDMCCFAGVVNDGDSFYARKQLLSLSHRNSVRLSVCLSVRLSHGWISQKQCKLESPNLHRRLPVSGTVKLFYKFEGSHPERGC